MTTPRRYRYAAALSALMAVGSPLAAQNAAAREERRANGIAASLEEMMNPRRVPAHDDASAKPPPAGPNGERCTGDGLIYAEVSDAVTKHVRRLVTLTARGSALRDAARLYLPCGFHLDARFDGNLVLTDGTIYRRYTENNAFGFAPAFGFGGAVARSYTLRSEPVSEATLRQPGCAETLAHAAARLDRCAGFGSTTTFFATGPDGSDTTLAHYAVRDDQLVKEFDLARIAAPVAGLSFIAPPDAPGGTVTLYIGDRGVLYRVFVDKSRG